MSIKYRNLIFLIAISVLYISAISAQTITVPSLDNLSQSDAIDILKRNGFKYEFKECFSNDVKKYSIIPGSQDPGAGINYKMGGTVSALTSLGPLPIVIGMNEDDAINIFEKYNLSYEVIKGRNVSLPKGYVYDQVPITAKNTYQDFKLKLFINSPIVAQITSPLENEAIRSTYIVKGIIKPDLLPGEYIWIGVKPNNSMDWWPQTQNNNPIIPVNGYFEGYAYIGGKNGERSEIAVLLVDDELNKILREWENHSSDVSNWPPITKGDPLTRKRISKNVIESKKIASVNITLQEPDRKSDVDIFIKDSSLNVIPNAQITARDGSNLIIRRTVDSEGSSNITGTPGLWKITSKAPGYIDQNLSITVPKDVETSITFYLTEKGSV